MGLGFLGVMDRAVEKCVTRKFAIPVRKWHHMTSLKFQVSSHHIVYRTS